MEDFSGESLVGKAERTFRLIQGVEKALERLDEVESRLRRLAGLIPQPQGDSNGDGGKGYVYSVSDPKSLRSVASTRYFSVFNNKDDGRLKIQIGKWGSDDEAGMFLTREFPTATAETDGVMSRGDKAKLDGLESGLGAQLTALGESLAGVRAEVAALREWPRLRARLLALGYSEAEAEGVFVREPLLTSERVDLREGLLGLNYSVEEVEEAMEDVPGLTQGDIEYAREFMEGYDTGMTTWSASDWNDKSALVVMPKLDTSRLVTVNSYALGALRRLEYIPRLDFSGVRTFNAPWCNYTGTSWVHIKRFHWGDWPNLTVHNGLCIDLKLCTRFPEVIHLPNITNCWNIFAQCESMTNEICPRLDAPKCVKLAQTWQQTGMTQLPQTHFGNVTNMESAFRFGLWEDLSKETLTWDTEKEVIINGLFFYSPGRDQGADRYYNEPVREMMLPRIGEVNVGPMYDFATGTIARIRVVPDYSHLEPTSLYAAFMCVTNLPQNSILERVEGLNFARLVTARSSSDGIFAPSNLSERYAHGNLRYVRILNLGQGPCTDIDLRGTYMWGDGGEENLRSLVDSLLTNSFDRAAAGMETAILRLPKQVWGRLSQAQQAEVTAKGYSVTLSNF